MNYEIEFKMIEIKDLSKIQRNRIVQDDTITREQTEDVTNEYCKEIMHQVEKLLDSDCKIKYNGCIDRIGNFIFIVLHDDVEYTVIMQIDTYEWNRQLTIKMGYSSIRVGIPAPEMHNKIVGYDIFLEKLKMCIKNILIRDWYKCVWIKDAQSLELSKEVYSDIYMAENKLRAFVSRVMIENFGIEWYDRPEFYKLNASIQENAVKIKRNVPNFNNIDVSIYTATLETLMETVKSDIYSDSMQNSLEIQRKVKDRIFATTQLNKMQSTLDFLKSMYDKKYNIWERIFEPLISDSSRWEKLLTTFIDNRNHVAHNKLLDYSSKNTMLKDTREFIKLIEEAVAKFDIENCSEEVEETLQAIEDQQEYARDAQLEIIESEAGVTIRNKEKILKMFQDTIDDIYTDAVDKTYFDEGIDISESCNLHEDLEEQLVFSITGMRGNKLEVYGILDIDDSEGAISVMKISVYETEDNILNKTIKYVNGKVEYDSEQTSYMSVVMDLYDDSCVDDIKNEIEEFVIKQREDKNIIDYVERKNAEDDWEAEAADIFENN